MHPFSQGAHLEKREEAGKLRAYWENVILARNAKSQQQRFHLPTLVRNINLGVVENDTVGFFLFFFYIPRGTTDTVN